MKLYPWTNKFFSWLFKKGKSIPLFELCIVIGIAICISWVVSTSMLDKRDLLWEQVIYQAQDIDFDQYDIISEMYLKISDMEHLILILENRISDLENPWQHELDQNNELPGLDKEHVYEVRNE